MNVVILNDFASIGGGAAAVAVASAKGLAERGHRVFYLAAVGPTEPSLLHCGVEVIDTGHADIRANVSSLSAQMRMTWNSGTSHALDKLIGNLDPVDTVVHLHGWTKALSSSVARAAKRKDFSLVCTLHDYAIACPRGSFFDRAELSHCERRPLSAKCVASGCEGDRISPRRLSRTFRHIVQQRVGGLPSRVDAFVFVSRFSRKIMESQLPQTALMKSIANPVSVSRGDAVDVAANAGIVMVGRLTLEKGAVLAARGALEAGVPITFVGDGPCREDIVSANPSSRFTGWLSLDGVLEQLRGARALIFPSRWLETQGLVVSEAAAVGVPTIASDTSAASEVVRHCETGLLFRNGDIGELADAIRTVQDDAVASRLGASANDAYWSKPPTVDRHVSALEELYGAVLDRRSQH